MLSVPKDFLINVCELSLAYSSQKPDFSMLIICEGVVSSTCSTSV